METLYAGLRSATRGMLDLLRDLKLPAPVLNQMRKYTENSSPGQLADLLTSTIDVPLKVRCPNAALFVGNGPPSCRHSPVA